MKKFELDARKLDCPKPLLRTKKALSEEKFNTLAVLVDNVPARENVCRFLKHSGMSPQWEKVNGDFRITVERGETETIPDGRPGAEPGKEPLSAKGKTVLVSGTCIGLEEKDLGRLLMKGYLYTLTQIEETPSTVIFMNSGVRLCLEDSESLDDLRTLEKGGTEILVCGTCLEVLELRERLAVGRISNMYEIASRLHAPVGLVKIG